MSKFSDALRAIKIYNNYDLLKRYGRNGDVVVTYHAHARGRLGWTDTCRTEVWSIYPHLALDRRTHMGGYNAPPRCTWPTGGVMASSYCLG